MKKLLFLLPVLLCAQVIDTVIPLFDEPRGELLYVPEGNKLYINLAHSYRFLVLDCSTFTVRKIISIPTTYPTEAYGLFNWRRNKIYYNFNIWPDSIAVIDNRTDSIIKWINFDASQPYSLCYNYKDDKIYASDGSSVAVIDCATDSITKIITQPYNLAHFVLWDSIGNKVYCGSGWGHDEVTVINCANDSVIAIIHTGVTNPDFPAYNSVRRKVYIVGWWGYGVAVIDAVGDTLIRYHSVYFNQDDVPLIWNDIEDKVYLFSEDTTDVLRVIDCYSDSIIKNVRIDDIYNMCFTSWNNRLYCITFTAARRNRLSVFNCHSDSFVSQIEFGKLAIASTCNPLTQRIYVADMDDSALYVIRDDVPGVEEHTTLESECFTPEIYPNPARSYFIVRLPQSADRQNLKIFDVLGKLIKVVNDATSAQKQKEEVRISLKGINPGIYFIRLGKETKKFLVVE